jgi:hypothetical protein
MLLKKQKEQFEARECLLSFGADIFVFQFAIKKFKDTYIQDYNFSCCSWSLTLREERRLRVFENRVLTIFGPRGDEVTREWRKLHNEELNDLYCSPNIVRVIRSRMRWAWHVARMGERRGVYSVLVGKGEGKRPLGRPRRRWKDNINLHEGVGAGYKLD